MTKPNEIEIGRAGLAGAREVNDKLNDKEHSRVSPSTCTCQDRGGAQHTHRSSNLGRDIA
jgi:hypothetical protein